MYEKQELNLVCPLFAFRKGPWDIGFFSHRVDTQFVQLVKRSAENYGIMSSIPISPCLGNIHDYLTQINMSSNLPLSASDPSFFLSFSIYTSSSNTHPSPLFPLHLLQSKKIIPFVLWFYLINLLSGKLKILIPKSNVHSSVYP